ncbi:hypothetical protein MMC31_007089, partial [Peltigera leucophlebia]|nr:hypothetical protein [Peltigera leucophlebia]
MYHNSAVVIRLHNGTYRNITLIEGKPSYKSLLRSLATGPQNRIPDQTPSNWEKLQYLKKRAQRQLNKFLGRPAILNTGILAELISMLKTAAESWLGVENIAAAVLSSPDRIRLTAEEITGVFDYLGMRNLTVEPDILEDLYLYAASAAYAGLGMGQCGQYTDPYACELEEDRLPTRHLLHLDFNLESLSGTIISLSSAKDGSVEEAFIDLNLGLGELNALNTISMPRPEDSIIFLAAITSRISALVQSFKPKITQLVLTGTSAADALPFISNRAP